MFFGGGGNLKVDKLTTWTAHLLGDRGADTVGRMKRRQGKAEVTSEHAALLGGREGKSSMGMLYMSPGFFT